MGVIQQAQYCVQHQPGLSITTNGLSLTKRICKSNYNFLKSFKLKPWFPTQPSAKNQQLRRSSYLDGTQKYQQNFQTWTYLLMVPALQQNYIAGGRITIFKPPGVTLRQQIEKSHVPHYSSRCFPSPFRASVHKKSIGSSDQRPTRLSDFETIPISHISK